MHIYMNSLQKRKVAWECAPECTRGGEERSNGAPLGDNYTDLHIYTYIHIYIYVYIYIFVYIYIYIHVIIYIYTWHVLVG